MLKTCLKLCLLLTLVGLLPSIAEGQSNRRFRANLVGFEEVPAVSSPVAGGTFNMLIDFVDSEFTYELTYGGLQGAVQQAHIHIAQKGVNGGIMVFLCTNLGNGPMGTQACPASGTISGTIRPADVIAGAAAQGVAAGEFAEVLRAIRGGVAYVNVHSNLWPGGEIRGQLMIPAK
jgi:hypothetical protein